MVEQFALEEGFVQPAKWHQKPLFRQILATLTACLSMINWGTCISWTAVADNQLQSGKASFIITQDQSSWIGATLSIGGIIGSMIGGYICEKFGRKRCIQVLAGVSLTAYLFLAFAWNIWVVCVARLFMGIAVAASSTASSLYIAEISSSQYRGALGSCLALSVGIGIVYCMTLGAVIDITSVSLACAVHSAIAVVMLFFMPESPYYLAAQHDSMNQTRKALRWFLYEPKLVQKAEADIADYLNTKKTKDGGGEEEEVQKNSRAFYKLAVMSVIMAFTRINGVTQLTYFMVDVLANSKSKSIPAEYAAAGVSAFEAIGSLVAIALSDRLGRKLLLIISGLGMGTSNLLLLLAQMGLFVTESGIESTAVTLIAYSSFFVFFSVGFGGIPFVILGEVFPPKTKGLASSISVTFLWVWNFVNTKTYYYFVNGAGYVGMYAYFVATGWLAAIFVIIFLPETRNKTLAEVQATFASKKCFCSLR